MLFIISVPIKFQGCELLAIVKDVPFRVENYLKLYFEIKKEKTFTANVTETKAESSVRTI